MFLFNCGGKETRADSNINIDSIVNSKLKDYPSANKQERDSLNSWLDSIREEYPLNFDSLVNFSLRRSLFYC